MANYGYVKTEAGLMSWLQSALRKVWSKHPAKLGKVERMRVRVTDPKTRRMIYHIKCERCGKLHKLSNIEVNHKVQVGKNYSKETFDSFCRNLFLVSEEDLELLCTPCHAIITYMERSGLSEEDAEIEKKVIKFMKKPAEDQKAGLKKLGIIPASTAVARRKQARQYLKERAKK